MLTILSEFVDAILAQARRDHPVESCGVIAGPAGSDCPMRLIPMRNAAQSPTHSTSIRKNNSRSGERWKLAAKNRSCSITRIPVPALTRAGTTCASLPNRRRTT
ncbi:Mov34/MPN/PAD-1 family protein [Ralstonia syzygii]|uniref:Mov34/MPN/PAD-1 family protein n=1 Tax=Ralstonia syzygii TaxID=28097 RepID=UPI0036F35A7F